MQPFGGDETRVVIGRLTRVEPVAQPAEGGLLLFVIPACPLLDERDERTDIIVGRCADAPREVEEYGGNTRTTEQPRAHLT